jgi:hypothetical protein
MAVAGCGRIGFDPLLDSSALGDGVNACAATYVQSTCVEVANKSSTSLSYVQSVSSGSALVVVVDFDNITSTPTITDSLGNSFSQLAPPMRSTTDSAVIWLATNVTSGTDTVTVALPVTAGAIGLFVHEYAHVDGASAMLQVATGNDAAPTTPTATTPQPDGLVFAFGQVATSITGVATGFAKRETCNNDMTADALAEPPGSYAVTFTATPAAPWIAALVLATCR